MRAPDALLGGKMGEERDGLDGLAEAHFVGQDAVDVLVVQRGQPVEAHHLVLPALAHYLSSCFMRKQGLILAES